jgi:hypothetical protein
MHSLLAVCTQSYCRICIASGRRRFRCTSLLVGVLAVFWFGLVGAPANAQMQMFAEWRSDFIGSTFVRTTGGPIGGGSEYICLRFVQPPTNSSYDPTTGITTTTSSSYSATLLSECIHENAGFLPDIIYGPGDFGNSGPDNYFNDPPVTYLSWENPWNTVEGHNGAYTVTAKVVYTLSTTVITSGPGIFTYQTTPGSPTNITQSLNFNVQNLLLTPTNPVDPNLIVWNPDTMQSVNLTMTTNAAYQAGQDVGVTIYDTAGNVVDGLMQNCLTSGNQTITFNWVPNNLPLGLYVFSYYTSANLEGNTDQDQDKSRQLRITGSSDPIQVVSDDGTNATYNESYTITDSAATLSFYPFQMDPGNKPAASGRIDVYDPNLNLIYTQQLQAGDLTPGNHVVPLTMPSPQYAGTYTFLITALDSHPESDKFGRQRYALQVNNRGQVPGAIAWGQRDMKQQAQFFWEQCNAMGYNQLPKFADWYYEPVIANIRGPLQLDYNPLRVACFTGHGTSDGSVIKLADNKFLVSSNLSITQNTQAINGGDCLILDTIGAGKGVPNPQRPLSYLQLVLISACDADKIGGDSIVQKLLDLGVQCVVVAGNHEQNRNLSDDFFGMPDLHSTTPVQGLMPELQKKDPATGKWLNIYQAVEVAVKYTQDQARGRTLLGDVEGTFKATVHGNGSLIINTRK